MTELTTRARSRSRSRRGRKGSGKGDDTRTSDKPVAVNPNLGNTLYVYVPFPEGASRMLFCK